MSPIEMIAIIALSGWAVYRQTVTSEVRTGLVRFKMAAIYGAAGLVVGGFDLPAGLAGWGMITVGVALSLLVGLVRGRYTRVWLADGRAWRRGTTLTVSLFVGLIAAKFALGAIAYLYRIDDGAGFGEVLIMIAVMMVVQAEVIGRRARILAHQTEDVEQMSAAPASAE